MRKWMSEKLKRRKKPPQDPAADKQPAPLQPAYFESAPQEPRTESPAPEPAPEPQGARTSEPVSAAPVNSSAEPGNQSAINARRPRRRRGRGGRGRRGTGPRPATSAPASGDSSLATAPVAQPPRSEPQRASKGIVVLAVGLPGSPAMAAAAVAFIQRSRDITPPSRRRPEPGATRAAGRPMQTFAFRRPHARRPVVRKSNSRISREPVTPKRSIHG